MAQYKEKRTKIDAFTFAEVIIAVKGPWGSMPAWFQSAFDAGEISVSGTAITISKGGLVRGTVIAGGFIAKDDADNIFVLTAGQLADNYDVIP